MGSLAGFDAGVPRARRSRPARSSPSSTTGSRPSIRSRPQPTTRAPPCAGCTRTPGELGADPGRLAVAGDSAGGNLAAVTARRLRDEGGPPLRMQALIYPVCDAALNTPSYREKGDGLRADRREHEALLGALPRRRGRHAARRVAAAGGRPGRAAAGVRPHRARRRAVRRGRGLRRRARGARACPSSCAASTAPIHGFFRWIAKAGIARRAVAEVGEALRAARQAGAAP